MDALDQWSEFNVAMLGAAAALAGLVIVAASVNIAEIIKAPTLTSRLAAAIAALVLAITACALGLIPTLPAFWFAVILVVASLGAAVFQVHAAQSIARDVRSDAGTRGAKSALGFLPVALYLIAGIASFTTQTVALGFAAAGCITAIIAAIVVSWVALVEVLR